MKPDFDSIRPKRSPTKKEAARYRKWRKYLKYSKLNDEEQHRRAASFAAAGKDPND